MPVTISACAATYVAMISPVSAGDDDSGPNAVSAMTASEATKSRAPAAIRQPSRCGTRITRSRAATAMEISTTL